MPNLELRLYRCNTKVAGILVAGNQQPAIFDVGGMDVLSVQLIVIEGTITNTIAKVRWSSSRGGPFTDYSTAITLNSSTRGSGLCAVEAKYAAVEVTTGEGSDLFTDVVLSTRTSDVGLAVAT